MYIKEIKLCDPNYSYRDLVNQAREIINTYGHVSVADIYDLVGMPSEYTDSLVGWQSPINLFNALGNLEPYNWHRDDYEGEDEGVKKNIHCHNCFHRHICGDASQYNDASMCKQYIDMYDVLCGEARRVVEGKLDEILERNRRLELELASCERNNRELEREVELLRIIKQTLEMQSGMKFDF